MKKEKDFIEQCEELHKKIEAMKYLYWKLNKIDRSFCSDDVMSYIFEKSNGDIEKYITKSFALKNKIIDCIRHYTAKDEYKIKFYGMVIVPMLNSEFGVYDTSTIEVLTNRYSSKYNVCLDMKDLKMQSGRLDSRKISKIFNDFLKDNSITEKEFRDRFQKGIESFELSYTDSLEFVDNINIEED